jgi:hypothetical protein
VNVATLNQYISTLFLKIYADLVPWNFVAREVLLQTAVTARRRHFGVLIGAEGKGIVSGYRAVGMEWRVN